MKFCQERGRGESARFRHQLHIFIKNEVDQVALILDMVEQGRRAQTCFPLRSHAAFAESYPFSTKKLARRQYDFVLADAFFASARLPLGLPAATHAGLHRDESPAAARKAEPPTAARASFSTMRA